MGSLTHTISMKGNRRCTAMTDRGTACQNWATKGFEVCDVHGGSLKDLEGVKEEARIKLELSAKTAVSVLVGICIDTDMPPQVRLTAARDILDRVGLQTVHKLEVKNLDSNLDEEIEALLEAMRTNGSSTELEDLASGG